MIKKPLLIVILIVIPALIAMAVINIPTVGAAPSTNGCSVPRGDGGRIIAAKNYFQYSVPNQCSSESNGSIQITEYGSGQILGQSSYVIPGDRKLRRSSLIINWKGCKKLNVRTTAAPHVVTEGYQTLCLK